MPHKHITSETKRRKRLRTSKMALTAVLIIIMTSTIFALDYALETAYANGYNAGATETNDHWMTGFYHNE